MKHAFLLSITFAATALAQQQAYSGLASCQPCHAKTYARWSRTAMANVVRDVKTHPDAIIPDFSKADPAIVRFKKEDIAFVYGSKWKQRYFARAGNTFVPLGAQWDIQHAKWLPYNVKPGTDWWTAFYPEDNAHRPTLTTCDGCHSVNLDLNTGAVTEWNVGCERCHGPGAAHVKSPSKTNIVNPNTLTSKAAVDTCVQCHSQGRPKTPQVAGKAYDFPHGYAPGKNLADFWALEEHKAGETTFTHFADGTAHKNRMQGNDFVQSVMYSKGVTCTACHDPHGTDYNADTLKPGQAVCLTCHGPNSPNGPHTATLEAHSRHKAGSPGNDCLACHMPKIEQTTPDDFVRAHTFKFIGPEMTEKYQIPNACTSCHKDKAIAWAKENLK